MAAGRWIGFLIAVSAALICLAPIPAHGEPDPALTAAALAAQTGEPTDLQVETVVAYRGERYGLRMTLPGRWFYSIDPAEDGLQLMVSGDDGGTPVRADVLTFTERVSPEEWPSRHRARWAAERYLEAELEVMGALGVDTGMYDLADVETDTSELGGRTFYTMTYRQIFPETEEREFENHAYLYLYFPDDYRTRQRFYLVHYIHMHEAGDTEIVTAEHLTTALAGLSTEDADGPRESTITWRTPDLRYVAVAALDRGRTFYFENDSTRQCFAFSVDGLWNPGARAGLFLTLDGPEYAGVELVSAESAAEFEGEDLPARASRFRLNRMREAGAEVLDYREEPAEAVYAGARRCSVELALEMDGEKIEIGDVFYAAVVRTGWAALVDAMRVSSPGDDDLAHDIIESLEFSDEAGCFREAIDRILD